MPQVIAAIASAVAYVVSAGAVTSTLYAAVYTITYTGISLAISAGLALVFAPSIPTPEMGAVPIKQSRPVRVSGSGRVRISGAYMFFEAKGNESDDVLALHHGRIDGIEKYYLHDDEVTLDGSGWVQNPGDSRYSPNHVRIRTRMGLDTETHYSELTSRHPSLWPSSCRGDGIASLHLYCNTGEQKYFQEDYPHGLPQPSVVARLSRLYDPRDVGQDPDNDSTWAWSDNPVLGLLWYLCFADGGRQEDYATRVLPAIDSWKAAADVCDELVSLKAGGTEKRYRHGGVFQHDNPPAEVIRQYLDCFDGWMATRGDGAHVLHAGKYAAPTVTFDQDRVLGYSFQRFVEDEQAVNVLLVSYSSPDHRYNEVETDPWRDEDDILDRGIERSQPLKLLWVQSNAQARRLAKRKMARLGATLRGTVKTNLYGLRAMGERYVRLQLPDVPALDDVVVEIVSVELDLATASLTFEWIRGDENIDAWNPATEEGDGPAGGSRAASGTLTAPTIDTAEAFLDINGEGGRGPRIRAEITGPSRTDLTWFLRWRVDGAVSWSEQRYTDIDPTAAVVLESVFVPKDEDIEVEAAYMTAGGVLSPWSTPTVVDTSFENVLTPPADGVWTLQGITISGNGYSYPALRVTGAVDNADAEAICFEYRQFGESDWVAAGTEPKETTRKDITSGVLPETDYEVAVSYMRAGVQGFRKVLGPVTAGASVQPGDPPPDGTILFNSSTAGAWSYEIPAGVDFVDIELWGGGGGGWYFAGKGTVTQGPGGGGAGYCKVHLAVVATDSFSGEIGAGSSASGVNGGATTCAEESMSAGGGGTATDSVPGSGGTASGGDTQTNGNAGGGTNNWDGGGAGNGGGDVSDVHAYGSSPGGGAPGGLHSQYYYVSSPPTVNPGAHGRVTITARTS